jgi:hypothetical protein
MLKRGGKMAMSSRSKKAFTSSGVALRAKRPHISAAPACGGGIGTGDRSCAADHLLLTLRRSIIMRVKVPMESRGCKTCPDTGHNRE